MTDVAVYQKAQQLVDACTDEECDAVLAAIEVRVDRWELEHRRSTAVAPRTAPLPTRRKVGLFEAIRGVECCDPAVRASWALWRVCLFVFGLIVLVAASAAVVYGSAGVGIVLLVLFVVCAAVSKSITGGSASVCH
jgi:hypothetical protein